MRIIRLIHSLDPKGGGPAEAVRHSSEVLQKSGHPVEVVTLDPPAASWVAAFPVPCRGLGPAWGGYGYSRKLIPWLKSNLQDTDVVIIHGLWQYHGFAAWQALRKGPVPYFAFPHGMLDPWFRKHYPLKHLKKWFYWRAVEHRVLRDAKAVLFTSEEERRLAKRSFSPYCCRERVVNYGTADPGGERGERKDQFLEKFPELGGKKILLFLGRIHEKKGIDNLIRAFARVQSKVKDGSGKTLILVVAGSCERGPCLEGLKKTADRLLPPASIFWTGMLRGDLKWGAFSAADAFILPSHQENFGIAVAESLAMETPVLISNKVNIWREIQEDGAGFIEEDNLEGTTRLLERWLETDEKKWKKMARAARRCFQNRFEIHKAAESLWNAVQ